MAEETRYYMEGEVERLKATLREEQVQLPTCTPPHEAVTIVMDVVDTLGDIVTARSLGP
jgi:hypothetical protein